MHGNSNAILAEGEEDLGVILGGSDEVERLIRDDFGENGGIWY